MEPQAEYKTTESAEESVDSLFDKSCEHVANEAYRVPYSFLLDSQKLSISKAVAFHFANEALRIKESKTTIHSPSKIQ